ncbi:MAG: hypothetical protein K8J09_15350 [Planctomycetes bacterium]|nr:hypothetical protein [Planctomycetota bacterium]MCC7397777.1 hypothetical protein [Planctomycetota bacterium]
MSIEQRIDAVFELTRLCYVWNHDDPGALRLQRLLSTCNAHGVEHLVVGAHALAAHGLIRATKDLAVLVRPSPQNAPHVLAALAAFGAPLHDLTEQDLQTPGLIFPGPCRPRLARAERRQARAMTIARRGCPSPRHTCAPLLSVARAAATAG